MVHHTADSCDRPPALQSRLTSPRQTTKRWGNPQLFCFKRSRTERTIKSLLGFSAPVCWRNLHLLLSKNILRCPAFCCSVWSTLIEMILFVSRLFCCSFTVLRLPLMTANNGGEGSLRLVLHGDGDSYPSPHDTAKGEAARDYSLDCRPSSRV